MIRVHSVYVGQPQTITDENGTWRSSIYRERVSGPIELQAGGLVGDRVTDTENHGSLDQAVCCHSMEHYEYWNGVYDLTGTDRELGAGSLGENWTLIDADEAKICIGDVYRVGGATIQVSGARIPCGKQVRKTGLPDFRERTLETLRLGFYLRVLTPGTLVAGDNLILEDRPQPRFSLRVVNACAHHKLDRDLAQQLIDAPELALSWRRIFQARLERSAAS